MRWLVGDARRQGVVPHGSVELVQECSLNDFRPAPKRRSCGHGSDSPPPTGLGHLLGREHDSTLQSGVEAPGLLKLGLLLLFGTLLVVCVHSTPTCNQTKPIKVACKDTWKRGPVHVPVGPQPTPSCHVQGVNPRTADANTSHRPSISSTHGVEMKNPKHLDSPGLLEFFCLVGLVSSSHQAPQLNQLQHHHARDEHQHEQYLLRSYMCPYQFRPGDRPGKIPG